MLKALHGRLIAAFAVALLVNTATLRGEDVDSLREHHELIRELTQEIGNAMRNGKHKEARELQEELGHLMRERAESMRKSRSKPEDAQDERQQLVRRLDEMARESHELRRAGKHEEAKRLQQEMIELGRRMQQHRPRPSSPIPEEKRIHQLHKAAENLEAGGFHEEAREFHQRAEKLQQDLERHIREEHGHNDHDHHPQGEQHELGLEELSDQVQELNKVMQQMQHQMRQMQEQLNHVRKDLSDRKRPPSSAQPPVQYPGTPSPRSTPLPYRVPTPNDGFQPPSSKAVPPGQPSTIRPQTLPPGTKYYPPNGENRPPSRFGDPGQTLPHPPKNPKDDNDLYRPVPDVREKKATPERKKQRDRKPPVKKEVKEEIKETKEVVLSMNSMDFMLDLDSGKTMDPPQTYRPEQRSMDIVPLQQQSSEQPVTLVGHGLSGFKGDAADWELPTEDLRKKLSIYPLSRLSKLTFDDTQSATYFYRTKDGAEGVLQLVELVDSPKGIRVRYRSLN